MNRFLYIPIISTVLTGLAPIAQAERVIGGPTDNQFMIGSLSDGNYRFCSDRPADIQRVSGACFRFRKQGEDVVGEYYYPHEGSRICITGEVNQNTVTGQGIEQLEPAAEPTSDLPREEMEDWRQDGFLQVGRAQFEETWGESNYIRFRSALLNLNNFYQFNAGTVLPPQTCTIAQSDNPAAQIPEPSEVTYESYVNERFDYRVLYPANILTPQDPPTNQDGRTFQSPDRQIVMQVYGRNNALSESLNERYQQVLQQRSNADLDRSVTYQTIGDNFFVVSGYQGEWIFYQKTILDNDVFKTLEFSYHRSFQPAFDLIVSEVANSFETLTSSSDT